MKEIKTGCYYYTESDGVVTEYIVTSLPTESHPEECFCKIGSSPRTHYVKMHKLMTASEAYGIANRRIQLEITQGKNIITAAENKLVALNSTCGNAAT